MVEFKKIHGTGTAVIFSNEEVSDMIKIVKALEDSDILMKGYTETLTNDIKEGGALSILPMLLGSLGLSLLTGRGLYRAGSGNKCNCQQGKVLYSAGEGKGLFRAGQGIKKKSLMLAQPSTNIEIVNYYDNEPRFNGVFSRNNLRKTIKNGAYVVNLDEFKDTGTHWVALYVNNEVTYFDSFGEEYIPERN